MRSSDDAEDFDFDSSRDAQRDSGDHGYFDDDAECVATVEDGFDRGAALSAMWIHVQSLSFRSGRLTAVCSGVTIDLRQVAFDTEGATIYVQSALSGITILVPELCEVVWNVDAIFGGLGEPRELRRGGAQSPAERTTGERTAEPRRARLRIVGTVVAGGLSVR